MKKNWRKIADQDRAAQSKLAGKAQDEDAKTAADTPNNESTTEVDAEPVAGELKRESYEELEARLTKTEQQAHKNWEEAMRAVAELENIQRRADRDIENAHKFGVEKLLTSLLPAIDSLEQALLIEVNANEVAAKIHEGIELTIKLLLDVLQKFSVEPVNPQAGTPFDPTKHEAISMQELPGAQPNTIVTVFQKGYLLHDRVIRAARVIVAKG